MATDLRYFVYPIENSMQMNLTTAEYIVPVAAASSFRVNRWPFVVLLLGILLNFAWIVLLGWIPARFVWSVLEKVLS